jgi:hypothetical protein
MVARRMQTALVARVEQWRTGAPAANRKIVDTSAGCTERQLHEPRVGQRSGSQVGHALHAEAVDGK